MANYNKYNSANFYQKYGGIYERGLDFGPHRESADSRQLRIGTRVVDAGSLIAQRRSRATNSLAQSAAAEQVMAAADESPIRLLYGKRRVGGQLIWWGVYNGNLVLQLAWCLGEAEAVNTVYLDDKPLPSGITVTNYTGASSQGVDLTLSAAINGYSDNAVFSFMGEQVGVCYSVIQIPPDTTSGFPNFTADVSGLKVYDPRDVSQSESDKSTWKFSTNPSLIFANFETSTLYGRGNPVDWDSIAANADENDDAAIGEKRNTLNVSFVRAQSVNLYTDLLAKYANAFINVRNGKTYLIPNRPKSTSKSLTAADIKDLKIREPRLTDRPTVVTINYTESKDGIWRDAKVQVKKPGVDDGTEPWREQSLDMPGIITHSEAYRYAVEQYNALNIVNLEGSFTTRDEGLTYEIGDVLSLTHPRGLTDELVQISAVKQIELGRWQIDFIEYDENRFSNEIVTGPNYDDTSLPDPLAVPAVTNLTLTEEVYQLQTGDYASRVRATWDAIDYPYRHQYRYRVYIGNALVWQGFVDDPECVTGAVKSDVLYRVVINALSDFGISGAETQDTLQALGKRLIPTDVPQITALQIDADKVKLSWLPSIDADTLRYELRQGASWGSAVVIDVVDSLERVVTGLSLGSYTFLVRAIDSIKQYSANPTSITITTEGPTAPSSLSGFEAGGEVRLNWPAGGGFINSYEIRYGPASFTWENGTVVDRINALRLTSKDIPPGTWEFAIRTVDTASNFSSDESRISLTVTLDTNAFLADSADLKVGSVTNMASWSFRPEGDKTITYVTDMGDTPASLWPNAMSTYTDILSTYHTTGSSEWLSEVHDFGSSISGTWIAQTTAQALSGSITTLLELSADNITWDQYTSLSVKASARYARIRIQSDDTLKVTTPGVTVRVSVIPREEAHNISYVADKYAVSFDGVNDWMDVAGTTGHPTGDASFTLEAWLYIFSNSAGNWQNIFTCKPTSTGGHHWLIDANETLQCGIWTLESLAIPASNYNLLEWFHFATTYDSATSTYTAYKNGAVVGSKIFSNNFSLSGGLVAANNAAGFWGNFKFHQLRYWNTVRTQQEIQNSMWAELTGTETGLVGLWPCNEGIGTTVADLTTNNNNGTLTGGASWPPRGKTVALSSDYAATQSITVSPVGNVARAYAVDNITMGSPSFFEVFLFDPTTGNRVDGDALVNFKGV